MKNIIKTLSLLSFVGIIALFLTGCQQQNVYGYDFETAHITYEIEGTSNGTSEAWIKGDKKLIETDIVQNKPDGSTVEVKKIQIQDGDKFYQLNEDTKEAISVIDPEFASLEAMSPDQRIEYLTKKAVLRNASDDTELPEPQEQKEIAGQTCDVYTSGYRTLCLWQGIPLQETTDLAEYGTNVTTTATSVELGVGIADSKFKVPSDYTINDMN